MYPISPRVDADGVPYVRPTRTGPRDRDGAPYVRVARPITTGFLFGVGLAMAWLVVLAATNLLAAVWQV